MAKLKEGSTVAKTDVGARNIASIMEFSATLSTTWTGTSAPYSQVVTTTGMKATDSPIVDVVMSGTYATDIDRAGQWSYIYRVVAGEDSVTFYAMDKPDISLPIQIKVVR